MHRLGNDHDAALDQPAQDDLRDRFAVFRSQVCQHLVPEQVVAPLGKRRPCLGLHAVSGHDAGLLRLLAEGMRLDLVHGGHDLVVEDQVDQSVGLEVAHADRTDFPLPVKLLHRPPRAVDVAERLVDQVQVEVVELQPLQRRSECPLGAFVPGILHPELRRDEKFPAGDAAPADGPPHGAFVHIGGCRVDRPVTGRQGFRHAPFANRLVNLVDAEPQHRHLHTVV